MAKAPRPGSTSDDDAPVLEVGWGDRKWRLELDAVTPQDVGDLRRAVGFGAREAFGALASGTVDLDYAAALVFLARRQSESRRISFDDACEGLTVTSGFAYGVTTDEQDPDHPE